MQRYWVLPRHTPQPKNLCGPSLADQTALLFVCKLKTREELSLELEAVPDAYIKKGTRARRDRPHPSRNRGPFAKEARGLQWPCSRGKPPIFQTAARCIDLCVRPVLFSVCLPLPVTSRRNTSYSTSSSSLRLRCPHCVVGLAGS